MITGLRKSFVVLTLLLFPMVIFAQMPGVLSRIQIGVSRPLSSSTYFMRYQIPDSLAETNLDTSFSKKFKVKGGYGASIGTYFPVGKIGKNASLNISVDFVYTKTDWDAAVLMPAGLHPVTGDYMFTSRVAEVSTTQMALPIGVDIKTGPEAIADKSGMVSFTFGTGVLPSMNTTTFDTLPEQKQNKIQPYLKAEVGVFAGINWKLRVMYAFGRLELYSTETPFVSTSLISRNSLTLSLMLQPLSFSWRKASWWKR